MNHETAQLICEKEGISPVRLPRAKEITGHTGEPAPGSDYAIYPTIEIQGHYDQCALYITTLHRPIIIGKAWMKKHGMVVHLADDSLAFEPTDCGCTNPRPTTSKRLPESNLPEPVKLNRGPQPRSILKKPSQSEASVDLTRPPGEIHPRKATVPASVCMIGAAPFRTLTRQKGAQVFSVSMQEILEQKAKDDAPEVETAQTLPPEFQDLAEAFSKKAADTLPEHRGSDHHIHLEEGASTAQLGRAPLYRMSSEELELCKKYIDDNLSKGFITASMAPYQSPVLFVRKPGGGLRFCVDYRRLNALTKKDRYPLPLIDETLAQITGAEILTKIDIRHAFNRIRVAEEDEDLTTFGTRFGAYKYRVMPFGLCNGPATFQHYMNDVLWEGLNKYCSVYMDDIIIYSKNRKDHVSHVRKILQKLIDAGLQADISKCEFFVKETKFLGLIVGIDGVRIDPEKIRTIVEWEVPKNVTDVRSFLGFCNFYRRFIRRFSKIVKPLTFLTRKDNLFEWSEKCQLAFDEVKKLVTSAPIL